MGPNEANIASRASQQVGLVLRGRWRLDALIGVGGMATVYSATHRNGSRVAIKMLNPEYAAQPEFVARFMREGYVANKINHPASVRVLDDEAEDGCAFLVMELLSGHSLERYARRGNARLPLDQVLHVSEQVLDLLAVAHGHGILHRDIKPANIHVTAEGAVKVLDFGIARLVERTHDAPVTQTGASLGTPAYMPPEQARGRWNLVDPRTDLWALGATMHALVRGERPRRAETVQEEMLLAMTAPLASLAEVAPDTPAALVAFVERATAFDMESRWPDALTMQRALRELVDGIALPPMSGLRSPGQSASMSSSLGAGVGAGASAEASGVAPRANAEPGSSSGPRVDTARMVPPGRAPAERDPHTLHATENTAHPPPSGHSSRSLVRIGAACFAVTLVAALGLGVKLLSSQPSSRGGLVDQAAAASPELSPTAGAPFALPAIAPAPATLADPPPAASAAATAAPPVAVGTPPSATTTMPGTSATGNGGPAPPPTAPPPRAVPAPEERARDDHSVAPSEYRADPSTHHRAKPASSSPSTPPPSIYDQRF